MEIPSDQIRVPYQQRKFQDRVDLHSAANPIAAEEGRNEGDRGGDGCEGRAPPGRQRASVVGGGWWRVRRRWRRRGRRIVVCVCERVMASRSWVYSTRAGPGGAGPPR
ncbi:hypothetical protein PVAP13_7KG144955 [Panicum virgatum]|uniref:Uncharacterized protein n=1 Tax=Panicum virgatum TaxID=38727 RepID=A0A8T0QAH8_PANVG|nr:hypothetical protein PVAP13_7KG144955 [Panicum virgatum]